MRTRFPLGPLAIALCFASLGEAQAPTGPTQNLEARLSPLIAVESFSTLGMRFVTDPALVSDLDPVQNLHMEGVVVPSPSGYQTVDLDLVRVDPVSETAYLKVDGKVAGGADDLRAGISLWNGVVSGEPGSEVYIAFTPTGTRGWITRADGRSHFYAVPDENGDWNNTTTLLVHQDDDFVKQTTPTWTCSTDTSNLPVSGGESLFEDLSGAQQAGRQNSSASSGSIECKIAVETDYQYYQLFGNLTAATNYAISLWGAISCRFIDATDVYITIPQLSIYTNANDPWNTPDIGGSSSQMLNEFQRYWQPNGFPLGAALAHFMSGANLGGGVAYVAGFCSPYGVAVSGNLHGKTPMPVPTKSSLSWDFVVCAHETGHNFGTPHTHDYCPNPIDSCYTGICTNGTQCITNGTIMSYCHLCPGGMNNIQTFFHNRVANRMKGVVAVSCLCTLCPCNPPVVNGISPTQVVAYDPGGQEVTLTGKRFTDVTSVTVDGVPVPATDFTVDSDKKIRFNMPTVSRTGMVGITVEDDCGPSLAALVQVDPPAEPQLGVTYLTPPSPLVSSLVGLPLTVSANPGDLAFVLWSPDLIPTNLPGFLSLEIGNNFATLFELWSTTIPAKAWDSAVFPIAGLPIGSVVYVQAAILSGPGAFPLVSSQSQAAVVWF